MINRTKLTIKLYQGDEYNRRLTLLDDNDVPYDLSGCGAVMEIRPTIRERDLTGKWTGVNPPMLRLEKGDGITLDDQGNVDIFVSSERSYNLPSGQFKYDLELIDGDSVHTILYGDVRIIGEITDSDSPYLEFSETYKGLPGGGTTGQHLTKASDEPYDAEWTDVPTGGEGSGTPGQDGEGVPEGGTTGQILAKVDDTDFNTEWVDQSVDGGSDVDLQPLIDRIDELEARLDVCCPPVYPLDKHTFVTNREVTWTDLPNFLLNSNTQQADNGSLVLLDTQVRANVPVLYETGEMVEQLNVDTRSVEMVPELKTRYETRAVYTYEADFDWCNAPSDPSKNKSLTWLVDVLQFKNNQLLFGRKFLRNTPAVEITAVNSLDTSNLTEFDGMFGNIPNFNQPINHLDTSNVTYWRGCFNYAESFNQPLDQWDTSNTRAGNSMENVFNYARVFDQDISNWCVEIITSKPWGFDNGAAFAGQNDKQPKWGVAC